MLINQVIYVHNYEPLRGYYHNYYNARYPVKLTNCLDNIFYSNCIGFLGSGELEFEEFVTLASRFMVEEDAEAMQQELKEAFRLYDKEGGFYS